MAMTANTPDGCGVIPLQLEQAGFVRRRPNPHNRRQNMVETTEKARCLEERYGARD